MCRSLSSAHRAKRRWMRLSDVNYGLRNIQLKLQIPTELVHKDSGTVAGGGDLLVGVKWRFSNNERSQFQLGTYPQVLLPTGDHARGLGEGKSALYFRWSRRKVGRSGRFTAMLDF